MEIFRFRSLILVCLNQMFLNLYRMLLTTKLISNSNLSCVTPFVIHLCSFTFKRDHHLCLMNTFLIYVCYHSVEAEQLAVAFMGKVVRVSQRQVHSCHYERRKQARRHRQQRRREIWLRQYHTRQSLYWQYDRLMHELNGALMLIKTY